MKASYSSDDRKYREVAELVFCAPGCAKRHAAYQRRVKRQAWLRGWIKRLSTGRR